MDVIAAESLTTVLKLQLAYVALKELYFADSTQSCTTSLSDSFLAMVTTLECTKYFPLQLVATVALPEQSWVVGYSC
jgi:hypothetical protein